MRSRHFEKAVALVAKIGLAIRNYNTAELSRVWAMSNALSVLMKVHQLTGHMQ